MTRFGINGGYFMHSTPEYNAKHKKENSEYNKKYYQAHKEKWGVDKDSDSDTDSDGDSEDKDKKNSKKKEEKKLKLNGGSKAIAKSKKASTKKTSEKTSEKTSKKKETEEEKAEREKKEQEEAERKAAEERQKNEEYAEQLKKQQEAMAKIAEAQNGVKKKKSKTVAKHSCMYIGVNTESYLKHHGITNQKWGVKHGPPYPLAREVARAVKKGASEGLKQGGKQVKNYAIQNTIRPATDRIQKVKNPQKFNPKKIAKTALVMTGSAVAAGVLSKLVDFGVDKAVKGGKVVVGNMLMRAPHDGIANVGVNILLNAARTTRR